VTSGHLKPSRYSSRYTYLTEKTSSTAVSKSQHTATRLFLTIFYRKNPSLDTKDIKVSTFKPYTYFRLLKTSFQRIQILSMVSTRSNGVRKVPPPAKKVVKAKPKKASKKIVKEKQHEKNVEKVEIAKSEETKESPEEKKNEEDPAEKKQKVEEKKTTKKKSAEKVEPVAKNAASKDNDKKTVTIEACKQ